MTADGGGDTYKNFDAIGDLGINFGQQSQQSRQAEAATRVELPAELKGRQLTFGEAAWATTVDAAPLLRRSLDDGEPEDAPAQVVAPVSADAPSEKQAASSNSSQAAAAPPPAIGLIPLRPASRWKPELEPQIYANLAYATSLDDGKFDASDDAGDPAGLDLGAYSGPLPPRALHGFDSAFRWTSGGNLECSSDTAASAAVHPLGSTFLDRSLQPRPQQFAPPGASRHARTYTQPTSYRGIRPENLAYAPPQHFKAHVDEVVGEVFEPVNVNPRSRHVGMMLLGGGDIRAGG